jgi:hypothetical protein
MILAAIKDIQNIETKKKFKITLSLKIGGIVSKEFNASKSKRYPTIKSSVMSWARVIILNKKEET